jgi:hypothetical protein
MSSVDPQINSHADARKIIRKVNVKMGIRIKEEVNKNEFLTGAPGQESVSTVEDKSRISLTAILFGL